MPMALDALNDMLSESNEKMIQNTLWNLNGGCIGSDMQWKEMFFTSMCGNGNPRDSYTTFFAMCGCIGTLWPPRSDDSDFYLWMIRVLDLNRHEQMHHSANDFWLKYIDDIYM